MYICLYTVYACLDINRVIFIIVIKCIRFLTTTRNYAESNACIKKTKDYLNSVYIALLLLIYTTYIVCLCVYCMHISLAIFCMGCKNGVVSRVNRPNMFKWSI